MLEASKVFNKHIDSSLKFGDTDSVYGPSAGGELRKFADRYGGSLITDIDYDHDYTIRD